MSTPQTVYRPQALISPADAGAVADNSVMDVETQGLQLVVEDEGPQIWRSLRDYGARLTRTCKGGGKQAASLPGNPPPETPPVTSLLQSSDCGSGLADQI
jgi:hypothetical protein